MGEVVELRSVAQAVSLLDKWMMQAEKMEALHQLACVRADMSEALLQDAYREIERLKGLL